MTPPTINYRQKGQTMDRTERREYDKRRRDGWTAAMALRAARDTQRGDTIDPAPEAPATMVHNGRAYTVTLDYDEAPDWEDFDPMAELVTDRDYLGGGVWITNTGLDWETHRLDAEGYEADGDRGLWYVEEDQTVTEYAAHLNRVGMAKGPATDEARRQYAARGEKMARCFRGEGPSSVFLTVTDDATGHMGGIGLWYEYGEDDAYLSDLVRECAEEAEYNRVTDLFRMGPACEAVARMARAVAGAPVHVKGVGILPAHKAVAA